MLPIDYADCTIAILKFPNNVVGKVFVSTGCKREYTMQRVFTETKRNHHLRHSTPHITPSMRMRASPVGPPRPTRLTFSWPITTPSASPRAFADATGTTRRCPRTRSRVRAPSRPVCTSFNPPTRADPSFPTTTLRELKCRDPNYGEPAPAEDSFEGSVAAVRTAGSGHYSHAVFSCCAAGGPSLYRLQAPAACRWKVDGAEAVRQFFQRTRYTVRNTLAINLMNLRLGVAMVFTLLMNEVRPAGRRSWCRLRCSSYFRLLGHHLAFDLQRCLASKTGIVNRMIVSLGMRKKGINFLGDPTILGTDPS